MRANCAAIAESLKVRLHNSEGITDTERTWLTQFHGDPDKACEFLINRHALECVTEQLLK
jgi:hypothetical protein